MILRRGSSHSLRLVGFADPQAHVAFAYVMNRGGPQWRDPRNSARIDAVYEALEQ